jgi:hypothetical protein
MPPWDHFDHDPPAFDTLNRLVARVDTQLLTDRLLDRDLTALTYSTRHDMYDDTRSHLGRQYRRGGVTGHV